MKRSVIRAALVMAVMLSLMSSSAFGDDLQPISPITLKGAIAAALDANNRIRAGRWAVEAVKKDVSIAWGSLLPKIEFQESYSNTNNPSYFFMSKLDQGRFTSADLSNLKNPSPINNYRTTFQFEMPVFAMKAYIAIDMANIRAEGKGFEQKRLEESIVLEVFKAYVAVTSAKAYKTAVDTGLEDAQEHLRIAKARLETGAGLLSDVLQAQTALSEAQMRLVSAYKNVNLARRGLGLIIGSEQPHEAIEESFVFNMATPEEYLKGAISRADIVAMEKNHENAKQAVSMAKAEYLPSVGIGGNYQMAEHRYPFGDEGKSYQVGVVMKLNVFDGLRRESQIEKANMEVSEAAEHLVGMKKKAAFEVYEALMSVDESKKRLTLSQDALNAALEGVRLIEKRYANSLAPMVSLIDAQTALDKARADAVAAEGLNLVSAASLEYAGGRLLDFFGVNNSGRNQ